MGARRIRRHAHGWHHRPRAGGIGRPRLPRAAGRRPRGRRGRSVRRRRVGEGGVRRLRAHRRRSSRGKFAADRCAGGGQQGRLCRMVLQAEAGGRRCLRRLARAEGLRSRDRRRMTTTRHGEAGGPSTLGVLEGTDAFVARHIGTSHEDQAAMLATLGYPSRAALMDAIVPASIRRAVPLALPPSVPETEALARLKAIASKNRVLTSMIGQGYYGTHTPGVIVRNILENPAWYTAYTPYQPEISQGRLEALVNFQTMVCDLTGMAIANASMLDEATAAAEAMTLCLRMSKGKSVRFFVADDVFAQTIDVVRTRAEPLGIEIVARPAWEARA